MATYTELYGYRGTPDHQNLVNKVAVAVIIKAEDIASAATPTAEQIDWAVDALSRPREVAGTVVNYVLAANNTLTLTQISDATDSAIQTNVDAAVDNLFGV